ncbi:MAG: outer membrane protein assembly factor BamE [Proteobacteria bacterium]|nr:outer membrane protein assembly factor BamE [Pseudomonadota bacterium]
MSKSLLRVILLIVGCITVSGCVPNKEYYGGYNFPEDYEKKLVANKTTLAQVQESMGSPTSESSFGDKTYYYIGQHQSRVAFLQPKMESQLVLALTFDKHDILRSVKSYSLAEANEVDFDDSRTRLYGSETGPLEQIVGNIGKFNPQQGKPKPKLGQ